MSTLDTMASEQLDTHLAQLEDRLGRDYANVTRTRLRAMIDRERARFAGARIHAFVPILIERAVRTALAAT
ncbi:MULTISPECIES: three-helix bundle dimerization domain-containing protein [Amycolatopsis]|uniref:Uncharacterized protein n=1 Tax=Amycolatopsis bullii TaxID=941987 RepID=A0ABQ3K4I3_9PSEU|nr:hypothetical protein [Amycolatopsis bullii]GHG03491.1 hypothetical protein GCM10017567_18960 [Amycolatopsis bullii]